MLAEGLNHASASTGRLDQIDSTSDVRLYWGWGQTDEIIVFRYIFSSMNVLFRSNTLSSVIWA